VLMTRLATVAALVGQLCLESTVCCCWFRASQLKSAQGGTECCCAGEAPRAPLPANGDRQGSTNCRCHEKWQMPAERSSNLSAAFFASFSGHGAPIVASAPAEPTSAAMANRCFVPPDPDPAPLRLLKLQVFLL